MDETRADFEAAFPALFTAARRLAVRIVVDEATAEDVAAEALARAWLHWRRVRGLPWRDAWVLRVTTNLAIDVVRRKPPAVARTTPAADLADAAATRMALAAALRALPRRQRQVVVLRHLAEWPELDVARALHLRPGTVRAHLHRGMTALRGSLGDDQEDLRLAAE